MEFLPGHWSRGRPRRSRSVRRHSAARAGSSPDRSNEGPRRGRRAAALGQRPRLDPQTGWRITQNVGNSPAHPTSLFSPPSAHGEPRHVGCSAPSTTSARPHALFRGFSYKNFAETGPIARLRVVWIQNPCGGTKCACFRACARVCRGGSLGHF